MRLSTLAAALSSSATGAFAQAPPKAISRARLHEECRQPVQQRRRQSRWRHLGRRTHRGATEGTDAGGRLRSTSNCRRASSSSTPTRTGNSAPRNLPPSHLRFVPPKRPRDSSSGSIPTRTARSALRNIGPRNWRGSTRSTPTTTGRLRSRSRRQEAASVPLRAGLQTAFPGSPPGLESAVKNELGRRDPSNLMPLARP